MVGATMTAIHYATLPPPASLQEYVECFRTFHSVSPKGVRVRICPNGFPGIAFQHHRGDSTLEAITLSVGQTTLPSTLFLYGQVTSLSEMHFMPPYTALQVVFKPHALWSLFGFTASALVNQSLSAVEFGAEQLNMQLITASSDDERIALCSSFLETKLAFAQHDAVIEHALSFIEQHIETVTVADLQNSTELSPRQLERRFKQVVGITPHLFIRIRRINAALRYMHTKKYERLIDIAYALNFHDQSHFIRDMKEFAGLAPTDILQKVDELYYDQVGSSYLAL